MDTINKNTLATIVTLSEGQKESVNVAQVKEVMRILFEKLSRYKDEQIIECVRRGQ